MGTPELVMGMDGNMVPVNEIISCFDARHCPGLAGHPKVFLFQAYQSS